VNPADCRNAGAAEIGAIQVSGDLGGAVVIGHDNYVAVSQVSLPEEGKMAAIQEGNPSAGGVVFQVQDGAMYIYRGLFSRFALFVAAGAVAIIVILLLNFS